MHADYTLVSGLTYHTRQYPSPTLTPQSHRVSATSGCPRGAHLMRTTWQAEDFPERCEVTTENSTSSPSRSVTPSFTSLTWKNSFLPASCSYDRKPYWSAGEGGGSVSDQRGTLQKRGTSANMEVIIPKLCFEFEKQKRPNNDKILFVCHDDTKSMLLT